MQPFYTALIILAIHPTNELLFLILSTVENFAALKFTGRLSILIIALYITLLFLVLYILFFILISRGFFGSHNGSLILS